MNAMLASLYFCNKKIMVQDLPVVINPFEENRFPQPHGPSNFVAG
jgi:hypothetical protein